MYFVYIIKSLKDLKYYIRSTSDIERDIKTPVSFLEKKELSTIYDQYYQVITTWSGYKREDDDDFTVEKEEPFRAGVKTGRNDPCPCGSVKKYKKCCFDKH